MKTRPTFISPILAAALGAVMTVNALATDGSDPTPFRAGYLHQFQTSLDDGGHVTKDTLYAQLLIGGQISESFFAGLFAVYVYDNYDFDGTGGLAGLDPWDGIHSVRLAGAMRWRLNDSWTLFGLPTVRYQGESGAEFEDSLAGGIIAGASKRFSDRLSIGPGFGYLSQLEDDAEIFPILLVDWKITDCLTLKTGGGVGASVGPGVALRWDINDCWFTTLETRYERVRFRLDENGDSNGGIGDDLSYPVYLSLTHVANENFRVSVTTGVKFNSEMTLEDSSGDRISKTDTSDAFVAGFSLFYSF